MNWQLIFSDQNVYRVLSWAKQAVVGLLFLEAAYLLGCDGNTRFIAFILGAMRQKMNDYPKLPSNGVTQ